MFLAEEHCLWVPGHCLPHGSLSLQYNYRDCTLHRKAQKKPHLAHTAGLAQGAHGPHVALVSGPELRGVVVD